MIEQDNSFVYTLVGCAVFIIGMIIILFRGGSKK